MSGAALPFVDELDRERARADLASRFSIEAGAGTGKTSILVSRIRNLVLAGTPLDRIAAITFTELAAGELVERVRVDLESAARDAALPSEARRRAREAVLAGARGRFETIHAFCAALLRRHPAEAGLPPGFRTLDGDAADALFERTWTRWMAEAGAEREGALATAFVRGVSPDQLRELLHAAVERRDLLGELRVPEPPPQDAVDREYLAVRDEIARLVDECTDPEDKLAVGLREMLARTGWIADLPTDERLRRLRRTLDAPKRFHAAGSGGKKAAWEKAGGLDGVREILRQLNDRETSELRPRIRGAVDGRDLAPLVPWIDRFLTIHAEEKRRLQAVDFLDQLLRTAKLLGENEAIRREVCASLDALLVDELQDTDPVQVSIVEALGERGLVVVGDAKQSIYRFRRADLAATTRLRERLAPAGSGRRLTLRTNFRSAPALLRAVTALCEPAFALPATAAQAAWEPLDPRPGRPDGPVPPVVILDVPSETAPSADERRRREAEAVARTLRDLLAAAEPTIHSDGAFRRLRAGDVAILFRSGTAIPDYERALRSAGLSYRLDGAKSFYARPEIAGLVRALAAVAAPHDALAVFAALRADPFALSERQLLEARVALAAALDPEAADLDSALPSGEPVGDSLRILRALRREARARTAVAVLDALLAATGFAESILARPNPGPALAGIGALRGAIRALEAAGEGFSSIVRLLVLRVERKDDEPISPAEAEGADSVRLLTIHRSKGLEFPFVVLADPGATPPNGDIAIAADGQGWLALRLGRLMTSNGEIAKAKEAAEGRAESVRLLYVALTRAKDRLLIPVVGKPGKVESHSALATLDAAGALARLRKNRELAEVRRIDPAILDHPPAPMPKIAAGGAADLDAELLRVEAARAVRERLHSAVAPLAPSFHGETDESPAAAAARAFGVALHAVLEAVELGATAIPDALLAHAAADPRLAGQREALARHAGAALRSEAWRRAAAARRAFRELPFVRRVEGRAQEGKIDLLFEEPDGLVIVDWKTDAGGAGALDADRRSAYALQLAQYRLALEGLLHGLRVKESILVFTATGEPLAF